MHCTQTTQSTIRQIMRTLRTGAMNMAAILSASLRRARAIYVGLLLLPVLAAAASRIPVYVPINFATDSSVELPVTIQKHRYYELNLIFVFANAEERSIARKLVGDAFNVCKSLDECGEASSFKITIQSGGRIILDKQTEAYGHVGFSARAYIRRIMDIRLRPGTYKITVEPLAFGARIGEAKTFIELTTDPRMRDSGD
jgi:Domain of unknown function (DUF5625)